MMFPLEGSGMLAVFLVGILFGYFLEAGGMGHPRKLTAQFALADWTVFKVMFTAIVVAAIGLWLFGLAGWLDAAALKIPTTYFWAMLLGGALLGTGMALGGYCPGTSVVGLFSGHLDAMVFMLGMLIGSALFAALFDWLEPLQLAAKGPNHETLAGMTGLPIGLLLLGLAAIAVGGFRLGARFEARHGGALTAKRLVDSEG